MMAEAPPRRRIARFVLVAGALVLSRALDVCSTYLASPLLTRERNPLVSLFGAGWAGLLTFNGAVTIMVLVGLWYRTFRTPSLERIPRCLSFEAFVSCHWFGTGVVRPWWHALWALPRDRSLVWQALGAVAAPVVTAAGLVVAVENLLVARSPDYAASTGSIVGPLIYATVLVAVVVGFRLFFAREYSRYCGEA